MEDVLKCVNPMVGQFHPPEVASSIPDGDGRTEQLHRSYPFENEGLPILPDRNNYYSGSYGEYFWHQNADQVFMYIPIADDIERRDIHVKFEAKQVTVTIRGTQLVQFPCAERIIPDGSFWLFETGKDGKRYIQLDMEKRFRMINWKGIFGAEKAEDEPQVTQKRTEMLEKLFAANRGMSKLSGVPAETMKEMMSNGDLARMIADEVYTKPQVSTIADDGSESELFSVGEEFRSSEEGGDSGSNDMSGGYGYGEGDEDAGDGEDGDDELRLHDMPVLEGEIVETS
jgi:hypothetical protein